MRTMRQTIGCALAALLVGEPLAAAPGAGSREEAYREDRAVIVVTGMRLNEDPANYRVDLSVAEGASVTLTAPDGTAVERGVAPFTRPGGKGGDHRTADFLVDLDVTYAIRMRFRDGTTLRIDDYQIPTRWKTHLYFHSTTGTLSPSSILRFVEDPKTGLRCCVYAVYPMESYRKLGGRQLSAER